MIGGRKLKAWLFIFSFCVLFTIVRLAQGWFGAGGALDDLPERVVDLVKWSTLFFFAANVLGDHGKEAVKSVADAVAQKK